jgi:hypothetical protein
VAGGLLVAESVEKVRTIKFYATIVPVTGACGNFDSMNRGILNHCFKNFDLGDFFNSLSHERTLENSVSTWMASDPLSSPAEKVPP